MDVKVAQKTQEFFANYPFKKFDKNQILIHAGDDPPGIFYLAKGQVREYDITRRGKEVVVNVFKPPAFFPMNWAILKTPNRYFYETFTAANLYMAPAQDVIKFLRANTDVMYDLLSRIYSGVDGIQRRMAHLMGSKSSNRIMFELVVQGKRFGRKQKDNILVLDMHEDELAHRAGLSRETVSRELGVLKRLGLVEVSHKTIIIKDLKGLESRLDSKL